MMHMVCCCSWYVVAHGMLQDKQIEVKMAVSKEDMKKQTSGGGREARGGGGGGAPDYGYGGSRGGGDPYGGRDYYRGPYGYGGGYPGDYRGKSTVSASGC